MDTRVKNGMLCPVCRIDLHTTDRQGIGIDFCPRCRGVWLERGELDKIVERSTLYEASLQPASDAPYQLPKGTVERGYANADMRPDDDRRPDRHKGRERSRGWLGDILDFD